MALNKVRRVYLGDYIQQSDLRNSENLYSIESVRGLSTGKEIIDTKANLEGVSLTSYKLMPPQSFAYVPDTSRRGEKISLSYNKSNDTYLVSSISCVFSVVNESALLTDFLYLFFCRPDFDRYSRFNSWGSAREAFSFDEMCRVTIPLPSIEEQRNLVAAWEALRDMKEQNEAMVEPLFALCRSRLQEMKREYEAVEIASFIQHFDIRNDQNNNFPVLGVNKDKMFMPTAATTIGVDLKKYKIVTKGSFVFSGMQTGRDICIRIAYYNKTNPSIVSPAYTTFKLVNGSILPEFFFMFFLQPEMDRYGWFISDSSVRSNLDWPRFESIKIPCPPIPVQQALVDIYRCASEAKLIAEEADRLSREICPALIQQAARGD